jgi:hypothetical protein
LGGTCFTPLFQAFSPVGRRISGGDFTYLVLRRLARRLLILRASAGGT